jgi:integrase
MKTEKLPRGVSRRGSAIVVSFALADGTIERRSLGPVTPRYAVTQREIFRREVAEGRYQKRQPAPASFKCADLWEPYLRSYRNREGKDEGRLAIAWHKHLSTKFATVAVEDVSTDLVEQYIEARRAAGMSGGTINRELATFKAMFHQGQRVTPPMVDRMPSFPSRLKESAPRKGFIEDAQYAVLAANAQAPWLRALVACAYSFGFRKGELLNLRVRQVDLLGRWISLEEGTTKNGEARKVKMTSEVYDRLCACVRGKGPNDFVFTRANGDRVADPRDQWYSLCVVCKLGDYVSAKRKNGKEYKRYVGLNLHDFRRSAVREMTRRGVTETVAMKISGHKTANVFRRYNITDTRDLEQATQMIEAGRKMPVATDTKTYTGSLVQN